MAVNRIKLFVFVEAFFVDVRGYNARKKDVCLAILCCAWGELLRDRLFVD